MWVFLLLTAVWLALSDLHTLLLLMLGRKLVLLWFFDTLLALFGADVLGGLDRGATSGLCWLCALWSSLEY